jgi:pimeloyl-ACP methyl ester carboxylesterase
MKTRGWGRVMASALALGIGASARGSESETRRLMIDVGDHRLEIARGGAGGPVVVFEAGMSDKLDRWLPVATQVGAFAGTLCYSRAGCGNSDRATYARTPVAVAQELRELLHRAEVPPPFVLVGHSVGGFYVRAFAMLFPAETSGLVLVDPSAERMAIELRRAWPELAAKMDGRLAAAKGVERLEADGMKPIFESGKFDVPGALPDVPTVLITATRTQTERAALWRAQHSAFFQHVANGRHVVTPHSGHLIMADQPELVVDAIRWVVSAAKPVTR